MDPNTSFVNQFFVQLCIDEPLPGATVLGTASTHAAWCVLILNFKLWGVVQLRQSFCPGVRLFMLIFYLGVAS